MEVTETTNEGLKREFQVVVPASDLQSRVSERLIRMKDEVRMRGFRPGKVPVDHLRKLYGRAVMAETIEQVVRETSSQVVTDRGLKLAMEPKIILPEDAGAIEGVINGKADLSYKVAVEVVPPITLADFKAIKLERPVADVEEADVDTALRTIAERNRTYAAKSDAAASGDRVTISFKGTIDGEPFKGGAADNVPVDVRVEQFPSGVRGTVDRHFGRRGSDLCDHLSSRLPGREPRRKGGDVCGDGEVRRGPESRYHRRCLCGFARRGIA